MEEEDPLPKQQQEVEDDRVVDPSIEVDLYCRSLEDVMYIAKTWSRGRGCDVDILRGDWFEEKQRMFNRFLDKRQ